MDQFQAGVIDSLNAQDTRNQELLDQVIDAAAAVSDGNTDITSDFSDCDNTQEVNAKGGIEWGGKTASLSGTGGVALLEYAKDSISTAVSNISGLGTNQIQMRKITERKIGNMG